MAKAITEASYLKAMQLKREYEKQLQAKNEGKSELDSLKAVVTFVREPLAMILQMKEKYPKHSKSWCVDKMLKELNSLRPESERVVIKDKK